MDERKPQSDCAVKPSAQSATTDYEAELWLMADTPRGLINIIENRALSRPRDLLLPKLMSGKIRVCEAKKAVEAVV